MKPVSNMKYYKHNKGRLLLLVIPLLLSVILLHTVYMIINSYYSVQYNAFVETRKHYSSIQARGSLIKSEILTSIETHEDTNKVVPCVLGYTEIESVLSTVGVRVYLLYQNDLREFMDKMNLEVAAGRLPDPGKNEIILHENIIKNKNLTIGDAIGSDITAKEKLSGRYRIVGTLKGKALAGFASLEEWKEENVVSNPEQYGVLIYAKEGRLDSLNRYLSYLPLTGNDLSSYSNSWSDFTESSESIYLLLNVIYGSVLIIVSVCLGFLTYLFYHGRLKEFAILNVIGYSRQTIILRNISEVLVLNLLSAISGILCLIIIGLVLNQTVFKVKGSPLALFDSKAIVLSLCIPMLCIIVQTVSIGISFSKKIDIVGVIEMEDGGAM